MANDVNIDDRRLRASELLALKGFMTLTELVQNLKVSESTVRRDLELLEEQGLVRRTRGGAVYIKDSSTVKLGFEDRVTTSVAEKEAIGQRIAAMIPDGQTVILNGGTTCYQVACALQGRRINVITNSVPIASLLSKDLATEVTMIGGYIYPRTGIALGPTAEEMVENLHAGQLVMSCSGLTSQGAYNANQMMVSLESKMLKIADEVILAIDHSKFGLRGVVKMCDISDIDIIVTDDHNDDETLGWLEELGPNIVVARPDGLVK